MYTINRLWAALAADPEPETIVAFLAALPPRLAELVEEHFRGFVDLALDAELIAVSGGTYGRGYRPPPGPRRDMRAAVQRWGRAPSG